MSDLPCSVVITEEGPREGFQIEKGPIATERKVTLIDALSETGLQRIQVASFVSPKHVPGMADADEIVQQITIKPGVEYTALWFNDQGLERARASGRLTLEGKVRVYPSDAFMKRNINRHTRPPFPTGCRPENCSRTRSTPTHRAPECQVPRSVRSRHGCMPDAVPASE